MYFYDGPDAPPIEPLPRGKCRLCPAERTLRDDGTLPGHLAEPGSRCDGSYQLPRGVLDTLATQSSEVSS